MIEWRKEPFQMIIGGPIWIPPNSEEQDEALNKNFSNFIEEKSKKKIKKLILLQNFNVKN